MPSHLTLTELLLIAAIGVGATSWNYYAGKKRTREMKLAAERLGFKFTPADGRLLLFNLGGSYLSRGAIRVKSPTSLKMAKILPSLITHM